jgi:hypothetical protein
MADDEFRKGDKVEWKSHGQNVKGTVEERSPTTRKPPDADILAVAGVFSAEPSGFRYAERRFAKKDAVR